MTSIPVALDVSTTRPRGLSTRGKFLILALGVNLLLWAGIISAVRAIV
jgi:hypothetical protein